MKKIAAIAVSCILGLSTISLSSCNMALHDVENQAKKDIYNIYEQLKEDTENAKSDSDFINKIENFCQENEFKDKAVEEEYIYLEKGKSENSDGEKTLLFVETDVKEQKETCQNLAIALSTYKNAYENEEFAVLIADEQMVDKIKGEHLQADYMIGIGHHENSRLVNGAAGSKIYTMSKDVILEEPEGNLAYELKISGIDSVDSGNRSDKQMNPIVQLANFLSGTRSSGLNLEIASFTNNGSIETYPTSAKVVVVIDESQINKFENRLTSVQEKFNEKYNEKFPNAKFEFKIVDTPKRVLDYDDTESLLSLTYTLVDGVYKTTEEDYEGDVLGICTLAEIDIDKEKLMIKSYGRYIDEATEKDMDDTFEITSGLSDFDIKMKKVHDIWDQSEKSILVSSGQLEEILDENELQCKVKKTFEACDMATILEKNKKIDGILLESNIDDSVPVVVSLIEFLQDTTKE